MNEPIELSSGPLKAAFLPFGARLTGLWHQAHPNSLVLGYGTPEAYASDPFYMGAIVGPVANRVSGAVAQIGRQKWQMTANEGDTCLHSGPEGTSQKHWHVCAQTSDHVAFEMRFDHGQAGLPGNRHFRVDYRLTPDALCLDVTATSDRDTPVNFAHHPYWCLDSAEDGPRHLLNVGGAHYLPVCDKGLPLGEMAMVKGSPYDFLLSRAVPLDVSLDANLCVRANRSETPEPVATLSGPSGVQIEIRTTEPGLQIYNGSGLADTGYVIHDGRRLTPFAGLALEPQGWPDALNNANFPSIVLKRGARYHQRTIYRISHLSPNA